MRNTRVTQQIAGVILAGGRARRLGGIAKGMLPAGGSLSLIERLMVHLMRAGVNEIIIVANDDRPYTHIGCPIVPDGRVSAGPLAGIEAALEHFAGRYEAVLCLPCDLPSLSWKEISTLLAAFADTGGPVVFAQTDGLENHPLCAVLRTDLLDTISAALDRQERAVRDLWGRLAAVAVPFDNPTAFINLNSPDDVEAWLVGSPNGTP